MDEDRRIALLEQALVEYIERYGLTDLAREAMRPLSSPVPTPLPSETGAPVTPRRDRPS